MLVFSYALLFLWTGAIATACYTQNRSIIHRRFDKTPYELINGRKPYISSLHVFRAPCYPKNDHEDIGKVGAKGDINIFIGYSLNSCTYRVYNQRTKKIIETMNVTFDELSTMDFEQRSSKPALQSMTSGKITMYNDYIGGQPLAAQRTTPAAPAPHVLQTPNASTTSADTTPIPINSSSQATIIPNTSQDAQPTEKHLKEVKRIFCYLRGTVNMGLWYTKDFGFELTGFLDADYAKCRDTFKSTFGGTQFLGETLNWGDLPRDIPVDRIEVFSYSGFSQKKFVHFLRRSACFYQLSHSEIVDIEKVAVRSSLRSPNNKSALVESRANEIDQKSH
nr:retrovirus-related Pol polyprotein from transposon TNT 1-94 [Tanacetum cinerariifolium]